MILITGADGWLGYNLIKLIINNKTNKWGLHKKRIIAFVHKDSEISNLEKFNQNELKIFRGDLTNLNDLKKFLSYGNSSILIHAAGVIHPKKIINFKIINHEVVKNILKLINIKLIKKSIFISSNSIHGFNVNNKSPFDESTKLSPYLEYGLSKKLMEDEIKNKMHLYDMTIIRAPWFYGLNQPIRQTEFFKMIKKNKFPIIGNGDNLRSMVFIDNLVEGISRASSSNNSKGQTYWIADEKPYSMNEIVSTIKNIYKNEFGIKISKKIKKYPNIISKIARITDSLLQKIGIYNTKIHVLGELNMNIFCKIDKAKSELDYNPQYNLYHGMKLSIKEMYEKK
jgi:nucleoside-diphosphate-sugar epimerase